MEKKEPILVVKDLKQHFKINRNFTVKAVDGISFDIMPGETYGLVGESGSGKSTTGRSIIRLYKPTSGSIVFNGKEIGGKLNKETSKELHTKMQMIFQDPMACLNPRKKVIDIIGQGLDIHKSYSSIEERNEKNIDNAIDLFQGVNVDHVFTEPKRVAEDSENGSVVRTGQFAFNKVMKAHNTKLPIALREGPDCVVSNSYQVFEVTNTSKLLSKYLLLWLNRDETQRYAGFISFGTTRDIFTFKDMKEISIPIPEIKIQQCIVDIFSCYQARCDINEQLKAQIKDVCPILIKGSIEEVTKAKEA